MRLSKFAGQNPHVPVRGEQRYSRSTADEARQFRALVNDEFPEAGSAPCAPQRECEALAKHALLESAGLQRTHASVLLRDLGSDALDVRLVNGPLAGCEIEARRAGDGVLIRIIAHEPGYTAARRLSSREIADMLSIESGYQVSVEVCNAGAPT